jgi:hypothetical protein
LRSTVSGIDAEPYAAVLSAPVARKTSAAWWAFFGRTRFLYWGFGWFDIFNATPCLYELLVK